MTAAQRVFSDSFLGKTVKAALCSEWMQCLTYPHSPDRFIELIDPSAVREQTVGTIVSLTHPTSRSVRVRVRPNDQWRAFKAGQSVEFAMEIDGRRERRMFSPAQSAHDDSVLEFTMAVNPEGKLTRFLQSSAHVGDRVFLGAATGEFCLPSPRPDRIVLISAGSGITPLLSMLRTLGDEAHAGRIDFIHYCRRKEDALYPDVPARLSTKLDDLHVHTIYTQEGGAYFSREQLDALAPGFSVGQTFVCGPAPLLEATREFFDAEQLGDRLHQEAFTRIKPAANDHGAAARLHFARSDIESVSDGATILEQAEAAGLAPEYGCRMGVCFSCTCRKRSGRVRDLRTGDISADGEQDIQICVSQPVDAVSVEL